MKTTAVTEFAQGASGSRRRQVEIDGVRVLIEPVDYDDARGARLAQWIADMAPQYTPTVIPEEPKEAEIVTTTIHTPVAVAQTSAAITVGQRVKIVKGCKARELPKGVTCRISDIRHLGAEYGHTVKVSLTPMNGFKSGKTFGFIARHANRLSDPVIRMNDGDPTHVIEVVRA